jgi:hypothetical protein
LHEDRRLGPAPPGRRRSNRGFVVGRSPSPTALIGADFRTQPRPIQALNDPCAVAPVGFVRADRAARGLVGSFAPIPRDVVAWLRSSHFSRSTRRLGRHFGRIGFVRHSLASRPTVILAALASFARLSTRLTRPWPGDRPEIDNAWRNTQMHTIDGETRMCRQITHARIAGSRTQLHARTLAAQAMLRSMQHPPGHDRLH